MELSKNSADNQKKIDNFIKLADRFSIDDEDIEKIKKFYEKYDEEEKNETRYQMGLLLKMIPDTLKT